MNTQLNKFLIFETDFKHCFFFFFFFFFFFLKKRVTDRTYIYIFKHFLTYYLLIGLYIYTYFSGCFKFLRYMGGGGWGDAQLK